MRISDWSSDVCSSDLDTDWTGFDDGTRDVPPLLKAAFASGKPILEGADFSLDDLKAIQMELVNSETSLLQRNDHIPVNWSAGITGGTTIQLPDGELRSEEHTSELQSLMRLSYAVFCLKKKKKSTKTS